MAEKKNPSATKVDRRIVRTKKAIDAALDKLLSEKNLSKITVSAIAREADIDRKTFYLHYSSIDELFAHRSEETIEFVLDTIRSCHQGPRRQRIHNTLTVINQHVSEHIAYYANIAASLSIDEAINMLNANIRPAFAHTGVDERLADNADFRIRMRFYLSGAYVLYRTWILSDHATPIESVSSVLEDMLDTDEFPALALTESPAR